jgi:hypothetical protein
VTQGEQAQIAEFVAAVEAAQRHGSQWQVRRALGGQVDAQTTLGFADDVIARLHNGLQALESANALNFEPPQGYETVKAQLNRYLLQAAESGILALSDQMQQWQSTGMYVQNVQAPTHEPSAQNVSATRETAGPSHAPAGAQQSPGSGLPPSQASLITLGLQKLSDTRGQLSRYEHIVDTFPRPPAQGGPLDPMHEFARLSKVVAQSVTRDINSLSVQLNIARLESLGTSFDNIIGRMNARSIHAVAENPAVHEAWDVIDRAQEVDAKQLANAKVVASAYLDGVDALSEQLCVEVAARIDENDSPLWRCALDAAAAFQTYGSFLRQVRDEARPGAATPASATPADATPAHAVPSTGGARGASTGDSSRARETAATPRPRARTPAAAAASSQASETGTPGGEPASSREPAQAQAQVQAPRISYRDLARSVDGDVVSIARALGKDSSTLEQLRSPSFDPIESAQYARNAVHSWLGDIDNVRKTLRRTATGASANAARIDQLTDRLDALTTIHQHIATVESDALKTVPCPKAKHLKRLLQLNQLDHVGTPVRLPSAGDVGDRGTLFEMAVQPKPLANGEAARPFYVHLHSAELMDAATAGTVPFRRLTAVHVKTEAHRRLGARWEQMANALGSVHRGKIDAALLGELRAFARTA